jgi:hypothetical protein
MRCRGNVVCIATSYGLTGPGIEFLGPKKDSEQWLPRLFLVGNSAGVSYASTLFYIEFYLLRIR